MDVANCCQSVSQSVSLKDSGTLATPTVRWQMLTHEDYLDTDFVVPERFKDSSVVCTNVFEPPPPKEPHTRIPPSRLPVISNPNPLVSSTTIPAPEKRQYFLPKRTFAIFAVPTCSFPKVEASERTLRPTKIPSIDNPSRHDLPNRPAR